MDRAAGSDGSSQGPLQPGCVVEKPCVSGSVCHWGGPLRTGLRCFRSDKSQTGSVTAGSLATEGQPTAIRKVYSRAELNLSCLEVSFLFRPETQRSVSVIASFHTGWKHRTGICYSLSGQKVSLSVGGIHLSLSDEEEIVIGCLSIPRM